VAETAYDAAIAAAATQKEKDRLRDLRLRFNTPPNSAEWTLYAILAPLFDRGRGGSACAGAHASPRNLILAFVVGALVVAIVSAYVSAFGAHANEVLVAVVALVAGCAIATLYYEVVRR
jgi:hypothetical protein